MSLWYIAYSELRQNQHGSGASRQLLASFYWPLKTRHYHIAHRSEPFAKFNDAVHESAQGGYERDPRSWDPAGAWLRDHVSSLPKNWATLSKIE